MAITISVPDALRQSVEAATGGKNTVLYDGKGYPSVMVVVPKFNLQDIDASLGTGVHPAFIVGGVEKTELFIGKYLAKVHDNNALSLPGQDPANSLTFDSALTYCKNKGAGWHLMTNAEWAAIALWCWKNGFMPRGNNNYGKDSAQAYETGRRIDGKAPGDTSGTARTLTGSGPQSWNHDNSIAGIADLNGNVWEWNGGLRLNGGEIQIIQNNDAADNTVDQSATSNAWKAIKASDGSLVAPGTAGTLKYDATAANGTGSVQLDDTIDYQSDGSGYTNMVFESMTADAGITVPAIMKQLGLFPVGAGLGSDSIYTNNNGERLPFRGGYWGNTSGAGVFALNLNSPRSLAGTSFGFRCAYVV